MSNIKQLNKDRLIAFALASKGVTHEQVANMSDAEVIERRIPKYIVDQVRVAYTADGVVESESTDGVVDVEHTEPVVPVTEETPVEPVVEPTKTEPEQEVVELEPEQEVVEPVLTTASLRVLTDDERTKLLAAFAESGLTSIKKLLPISKTLFGDEIDNIQPDSIYTVASEYIASVKAAK